MNKNEQKHKVLICLLLQGEGKADRELPIMNTNLPNIGWFLTFYTLRKGKLNSLSNISKQEHIEKDSIFPWRVGRWHHLSGHSEKSRTASSAGWIRSLGQSCRGPQILGKCQPEQASGSAVEASVTRSLAAALAWAFQPAWSSGSSTVRYLAQTNRLNSLLNHLLLAYSCTHV